MDSEISGPTFGCVLFDLDGTLADSIGLIVDSFCHALSVVNQTKPKHWVLSQIGKPLVDVMETIDLQRSQELVAEYQAFYRPRITTHTHAFVGIKEVLADLTAAGVVIGVVTSKRRQVAADSIAACGLPIELLVAAEDVTQHKPHPAPLLQALEKIGWVSNPAVCYVGDATVDILAAQSANLASIAVTWGAGTESDLVALNPTEICRTTDDLRQALGLGS